MNTHAEFICFDTSTRCTPLENTTNSEFIRPQPTSYQFQINLQAQFKLTVLDGSRNHQSPSDEVSLRHFIKQFECIIHNPKLLNTKTSLVNLNLMTREWIWVRIWGRRRRRKKEEEEEEEGEEEGRRRRKKKSNLGKKKEEEEEEGDVSTILFVILHLVRQINWKNYPEFKRVVQSHPGKNLSIRFRNPYDKGILQNVREFLALRA